MAEYPIIEVPSGSARAVEPLGAKPKFWFNGDDGAPWLCKLVRPNTGEDWAEIVAARAAELLDIPHAYYALGVYEGHRCVVSRSMIPSGSSLIHGDELLTWLDPAYPANSTPRHYAEPSHTLEAAFAALGRVLCGVPPNWRSLEDCQPADGEDVLAGYVILDALVGNTDRHHQNWAVLRDMSRNWRIAPTFDHASCLGRELSDETRTLRMRTKDRGFTPEAYAERATSGFFAPENTNRPLRTTEVALRLYDLRPRTADLWMERISRIGDETIARLFSGLPLSICSEAAREFGVRVMMHNRNRLITLRPAQ